jgi:hypothetical protein
MLFFRPDAIDLRGKRRYGAYLCIYCLNYGHFWWTDPMRSCYGLYGSGGYFLMNCDYCLRETKIKVELSLGKLGTSYHELIYDYYMTQPLLLTRMIETKCNSIQFI